MARRKVAYRKRRQNRFSMFLVSVVVLMILVTVSVRSLQLKEKLDDYIAKQEQLENKIEDEKERTQEIEEFRKFTQTKKYVEEIAKEKLGLVYENEILFREEE